MGQVLYRKYRPKSLAEVVGQEHITNTLQRAVEKDLISHAYLFTGPHGVGKTSVARILAYTLGGAEYDESKTYIDIIEIDAASNRRIDEVRELRDKINIVPTELKYKIYIIDEVHMLTREAFNALLKTLEEPPSHAIFILATTEIHKLPETIISRCQRYTFKRTPEAEMIKLLKRIAKKEDIKIDDESLSIISRYSNGSPRDALSLLDQLSSLSDKITAKETRNVLGVAGEDLIAGLFNLMRGGDIISTINSYREAIVGGNDPVLLADQLAEHIRRDLHKSQNPSEDLVILKRLLDVSASRHPETELEIILLSSNSKNVQPSMPLTQPVIIAEENSQVKQSSKPASNPEVKPKAAKTKPKDAKENDESKKKQPEDVTDELPGKALTKDDWGDVLVQVKAKKNTLYGIMRMARADINSGELVLNFGFAFHVKRANDTGNKAFLESIIKGLGLSCSKIEIVHNKDMASEIPNEISEGPDEKTKPVVPEGVLDVFAGAEVLES